LVAIKFFVLLDGSLVVIGGISTNARYNPEMVDFFNPFMTENNGKCGLGVDFYYGHITVS